jgi:hypothetical protein
MDKRNSKKEIKQLKEHIYLLFLYNVDIVAFILFVKIYKNISVANLF